MVKFVFLMSMYFFSFDYKIWQPRFGVDTTAYINQAGQFISGQTDYSQISST